MYLIKIDVIWLYSFLQSYNKNQISLLVSYVLYFLCKASNPLPIVIQQKQDILGRFWDEGRHVQEDRQTGCVPTNPTQAQADVFQSALRLRASNQS